MSSTCYIPLLLFKGAIVVTFLVVVFLFVCFKFTCTSCRGGFSYCLSLGQNVTAQHMKFKLIKTQPYVFYMFRLQGTNE